MAWVTPKVYAILSQSDEGKNIVEKLPTISQDECEHLLDEFFGDGEDYKKAKEEAKKNDDDLNDNDKEIKKERLTQIADEPYGVSGSKEMREKFRNALNNREVLNQECEGLLEDTYRHSMTIHKVYLRKNQSSVFNATEKYIQVGGLEEMPDENIILDFAHEMAHVMDFQGWAGNRSYTYKSKKYGMTLSEMSLQEFNEAGIDKIREYYKSIDERFGRNEANLDNMRISYDEYVKEYYQFELECGSIEDIIEAHFGNKIKGVVGHGSSYWKAPQNRAGEMFAELFAAKVADKSQTVIKFIEKFAPKTLEIFDELLGVIKEKYEKYH